MKITYINHKVSNDECDVIAVKDNKTELTLEYSMWRDCCEKFDLGYIIKPLGDKLEDDDEGLGEESVPESNRLLEHETIVKWEFDRNPLYAFDVGEEQSDFTLYNLTSLDIYTENYAIYIVCSNDHNGYYPHGGVFTQKDPFGEVIHYEKFSI